MTCDSAAALGALAGASAVSGVAFALINGAPRKRD